MCSTVTLTQSNQLNQWHDRLIGLHVVLYNYTTWVVPPPSLTNFSSDLDESHNRSLGQVGGRVPHSPPPPWLRHWWTWCCQTFHKISWQLERLSIGLVVLCAVAAVAWSPSAARSLSWSATVRTSCAAVCGLVCSHNDCQQYRIIFVDADTVWVIFTCSLASYSLTLINSFPMATFGVTSYRVNSNYILG